MIRTPTSCRVEAMEFLRAAAEAERRRSPLAGYFRSKAAMWLRRASRCPHD